MANWIRAAQARAEQATPGPWHTITVSRMVSLTEDATFIDAARADVPRLCTALLEAVGALEFVVRETAHTDGHYLAQVAGATLTRVLTQADPEVEHG